MVLVSNGTITLSTFFTADSALKDFLGLRIGLYMQEIVSWVSSSVLILQAVL